ncbi:MAG: aminotransferase class V-fold PLP-dependent enzyme [Fimbriimonadaceae bacterium]|nr:aminotransferase class V-fold PLP-dependent enzyme [Fimbriimonadaceae bacterium]
MTHLDMMYLDHNATTPCDERILEEMRPFHTDVFANSGSIHQFGRQAARALQGARDRCAAALKRDPDEVVFTSGATEGIQLCLESMSADFVQGSTIFSTPFEHRAVQNCLHRLSHRGIDIRILDCQDGILNVANVTEVGIYVIQAANSETGVIQPIERLAEHIHGIGGILICDAAQGLWKIDSGEYARSPDAVILSAHKAYGPKGVGALMLGREFMSILKRGRLGPAQDQGVREGTVNVAGAVGMAATVELACSEGETWRACALEARTSFEDRISQEPACELHFKSHFRLPNTASVRFPGIDGDLIGLNTEVAVSFGTACSSGAPGPSSALLAMGLSRTQALETVRVSFGRSHSEEDGHHAAVALLETAQILALNR